ncbi:unnamed protein product [Leuciscus chuanchicus]
MVARGRLQLPVDFLPAWFLPLQMVEEVTDDKECLHRPRPIVQRFKEVRLPGYSSVCPRKRSPPRPRDCLALRLEKGYAPGYSLVRSRRDPFNDETLSGFQPKKFYLPGYSTVRRADSRLPPPLVARSGTSCHEEFHAFLGSGV